MNIIAAADKNWGIGYKGNLLCHIKEDMKFFKEMTVNKAVIMGKNTFLSLPGQKPLKDRKNYILTTDKNFKAGGAEICPSLEKAAELAKSEFKDEDIFIIGGESVYNKAVDICSTAYITKIDAEFCADKHIVNFDKLENWHIAGEKKVETEKGININFVKYEKK